MTVSIDVSDLVGHPGASRRIHVAEAVEGMATELARIPEGAAVSADLLVESVVEGVLLSGPVAGTMELSCARCLAPFGAPFALEVQELFAANLDPGEDDQYPLAPEGTIDLEPMIRDTVVLAMPYAPLCAEDCRGLCSRCGGDLNQGQCTCGSEVDPRWSALQDLDIT